MIHKNLDFVWIGIDRCNICRRGTSSLTGGRGGGGGGACTIFLLFSFHCPKIKFALCRQLIDEIKSCTCLENKQLRMLKVFENRKKMVYRINCKLTKHPPSAPPLGSPRRPIRKPPAFGSGKRRGNKNLGCPQYPRWGSGIRHLRRH